MFDTFLNLNHETTIITLDRALGKGGYGTVYLCYDNNNDKCAVKCIKSKKYGIPCLFEANLMSVLNHPCITKALKIESTPEKLYIFQDLAVSDLKVYRSNNDLSLGLMTKWIDMIGQGIKYLHDNNIIHGDIKASNVLVFNKSKIKITDFTLSTCIGWTNNYIPCTSSHRPLEVWLNKSWNEKIDIWSFGCTIYEIINGKNLFNLVSKTAAIKTLTNYQPSMLLPHELNTIIAKCLNNNVKERPNINILLGYSSSIKTNNPIEMNKQNNPKMNKPKQNNPKMNKRNKLFKLLNSIESIHLAYDLYYRLDKMKNIKDYVKLETCAWISNKIIHRNNLDINNLKSELYEILQSERLICGYLEYKIYP